MDNRTLHQIILETDDSDLVQSLANITDIDKSEAEFFVSVFNNLKKKTPAETQNTIVIESDSHRHDVCKRVNGIIYSASFTPYTEWLGMKIDASSLDLKDADIVALCLYEMTWYGDETETQAVHDQIKAQVEALDNGTAIIKAFKGLTPEVEAVAEAWASIDGKRAQFEIERDMHPTDEGCTGTFAGYMSEAYELIERINARGFDVVRIETV